MSVSRAQRWDEVRVDNLEPAPYNAAIAHLVEHTLGKGEVTGSIPVGSTIQARAPCAPFLLE